MNIFMKRSLIFSILSFLVFACHGQEAVQCNIKTSMGDISIELYPEEAPLTVKNFLLYVDNALYDQSSFFRVCTPENEADRKIKIEVIQGGGVPEENLFDPIAIETTKTTGLKHQDGTISMARGEPNTAQSSFFICINDQPELDFGGKRNPDGQGFAAFGKVIRGMETVKLIQQQEDKGQYMIEPVIILSIKRI